MYKFNKIKTADIIITSLLSVIISIECYNPLYKICGYKNLSDFYAGTSIYQNHNKFLDIGIYFLYLALFFLLLPLVSKLIPHFSFNSSLVSKCSCFQIKFVAKCDLINKLKAFCLKYQYFGVLGFVFIHPLDGNIYYKNLLIILFLVLISFFHIYTINKKSDKRIFSPFAVSGLIFTLFFYSYNIGLAPSDDHHFGEKFAAFLMHNNFNLSYYKDIFLVHGLKDIIPPWLGAHIFDQNNIYGYCLGEILLQNLSFIFIFTALLFIFRKEPVYTAPFLCIKIPDFAYAFICVYLLMIEKTLRNKPYLCLSLYLIFSFIFISIWTTIGSFWTAASLPFIIYSCGKIYKSGYKNKILKLLIPLFIAVFIILLFHGAIFEYLKTSVYYIKGSLFAFGNNFADSPVTIFNIFSYICKTFVLLFIPVLIIEFIKKIKKKEKDVQGILFLIFSIIFPLTALSYMLGRIDNDLMQRLSYFSIPYLVIIMPYFLYKFSDKKYYAKLICIIIIIFTAGYQLFNLPHKIKSSMYKNKEANTLIFNTGNIAFKKEDNERITNIINFVYKNNKTVSFLDLTNSGMLYLYLNKKIPIQYTSFYNSISTVQSDISANKIRENPPDIILIKTEKGIHDLVFPSLRVNSLYKTILLSGLYKLENYKDNIFLVKTADNIEFSEEELDLADMILSRRNLIFLPEVWANSLKTLPMEEVSPDYYNYILNNEIIITFNKPESLNNFDLMYIETKGSALYSISISGSNSQTDCKSKSGKILVPLDNYPSWILNKNIKEIKIKVTSAHNIENAEIKFYKRKSTL